MRCWLRALLGLTLLVSTARAEDLRPAEPYRLEAKDWPCEQPYQPALPLGLGWGPPALLDGLPNWKERPELRRLVEKVTAFDSATPRSIEAIADFVATLP